ncbi:ent-kaurene oxidase [Colletotrichum musicola]|uniref:Ent-kaurene oxidase n=1 Tax=Colletotrichum musicola TaxID=2175873 RepID=A0A8H6MR19_9PEZI|nr:ent-kaurene oxidase [Colletotrichum musicola]
MEPATWGRLMAKPNATGHFPFNGPNISEPDPANDGSHSLSQEWAISLDLKSENALKQTEVRHYWDVSNYVAGDVMPYQHNRTWKVCVYGAHPPYLWKTERRMEMHEKDSYETVYQPEGVDSVLSEIKSAFTERYSETTYRDDPQCPSLSMTGPCGQALALSTGQKPDIWTSLCLGIILIAAFTVVPQMRRPSRKLPYVNPREALDIFDQKRKQGFLFNFVNDIRNEPGLGFLHAFSDNFYPQLPGFEAFAAGNRLDELFQLVIKKRIIELLNKLLATVSSQIREPLSSEATFAVDLKFGTSNVSKRASLTRLSSRVFLGSEVCRDEAWLHITKSYTVNAFIGAETMGIYPSWMRSVTHWFMPQCKVLRQQVADSRSIIEPILERRMTLRAESQARCDSIPKFNHGLDWFEEESKGPNTMPSASKDPQLIRDLRKEIVEVLSAEGWKKTVPFNMKLADSVLKEAQRLKPVTSAIMSRVSTRVVTLPNGLQLQRGERCVADLGSMYDPVIYENLSSSMATVSLACAGSRDSTASCTSSACLRHTSASGTAGTPSKYRSIGH